MSIIDLNKCFPEASDGSRGPLPKQTEFLRTALDNSATSPRYIGYVGGIGSGKTIIGCITVISWAVLYPGDYLIGRLYMPELRVTTLKTFLEVCPPELIAEYRVADSIVKIKGINGKLSNVYFRALEEPDKFRSMNLSGFLIDECNQVSEEAFTLLQGRLRGGGIRKGIIVSNPNGHDWVYRNFFQKANLKTEWAKSLYTLIRAPSTENKHLPEGYLETLINSWSEDRIAREIEGSFDAFEGMVFEEFRRDMHVIKPFKIPENWPKYVGIDHGLRNPAAWIWVAVGPDEELYVYREFYESEWLIEEIIKGKRCTGGSYLTGTLNRMKGETLVQAVIDPSVRARRGNRGETAWDEYIEHLPRDFPLYPANNSVELGIDRLKQYLKVDPKFNKPLIYFFDTCTNLIEEISQYRYPELRPNQEGKKAENEKPIKANDHALDALRYVVMLMPEPYKEKLDKLDVKNKQTLEGSLSRELSRFNNPAKKDPFGF